MPYVARENGSVVGAFENRVPGVAEEFLSEGHADVVAFRIRPVPRRFSKRLLFGAMTDAQYATWKQVQAQQSERLQAVFAAATELNESDPDWPILLGLMNTYLGEADTAALLGAAAIDA